MIWDGETFSHLARQSNFNKLQKLEFDEDIITLSNLQVDRLLDDLPNLRELSVPVGTEIDRNTLMKLTDGRLGKHLMTLVVGDVELYSQRFESITIGD
ncbi:hypothetical protein AMATHDRAFT_64925 [Amanita thiersii Skay4041]|uniref:Uncharacterized protein n=1 Tax=Amanita thiersii Skay4041 TaxID=703135 RepID=A0A2A9NK05_9AGAR|nr:hypothetical protein AMATHDRAFT_64925 [Amanita thiersii Skay4041]